MSYFEKLGSKIINSREELFRTIARLRFKGAKIVFTNGCFDLLHRGHVDYLAKAADLGDYMVIGLNSDESVKRLKGPSRPVNDQQSRAMVLAGLSFVSAIVIFEEDTPYELIKCVEPDILVKGQDYNVSEIVGADIVNSCGGEVITLPLVQGFSTTGILEKI